MHKRDITYNDLDGNPITETFWFHLNRAELAKMALAKEGKQGGFDVWVRTLIKSQDGEVLTETFEKILLATIGERSEDNKKFIKTDEIRDNFRFSEAYSVLFMELMTDTDKVSEFINAVVPTDMRDEVSKQIANDPDVASAQTPTTSTSKPQNVTTDLRQPKDDRPEWLKDPNRVPTEAELRGATQEQLLEAFRRKSASTEPVTQEPIVE